MSDPLMDWLERNNPEMARLLHDERRSNGAAIERLQTQLDAVRGLPEQWFCVETRTMMESAIFATCADELEAKLKEAGDE